MDMGFFFSLMTEVIVIDESIDQFQVNNLL